MLIYRLYAILNDNIFDAKQRIIGISLALFAGAVEHVVLMQGARLYNFKQRPFVLIRRLSRIHNKINLQAFIDKKNHHV